VVNRLLAGNVYLMARDNKGPATSSEAMIQRELIALEKRLRLLERNQIATMPVISPEDIDDPIEGEEVIDHWDDRHAWYVNGVWIKPEGGFRPRWIHTYLFWGSVNPESFPPTRPLPPNNNEWWGLADAEMKTNDKLDVSDPVVADGWELEMTALGQFHEGYAFIVNHLPETGTEGMDPPPDCWAWKIKSPGLYITNIVVTFYLNPEGGAASSEVGTVFFSWPTGGMNFGGGGAGGTETWVYFLGDDYVQVPASRPTLNPWEDPGRSNNTSWTQATLTYVPGPVESINHPYFAGGFNFKVWHPENFESLCGVAMSSTCVMLADWGEINHLRQLAAAEE
jgi:hypothetical protein